VSVIEAITALAPLLEAGYDVCPAGACVLVLDQRNGHIESGGARYVMIASLEAAPDPAEYVLEQFKAAA
jgi:hypothetical protein